MEQHEPYRGAAWARDDDLLTGSGFLDQLGERAFGFFKTNLDHVVLSLALG
jgi:hypothetical protein